MSIMFPSFDPFVSASIYTPGQSIDRSLIAIDIRTKYLFVDADGRHMHEYEIPGSMEIQNCGGYVDKIFKYRDPDLLDYLMTAGVTATSFDSDRFPILRSRSPQLDLLIVELIRHIRRSDSLTRVSLFDHGCSVAEHYDALDVMLQAGLGVKAADALTYTGLDRSAILLTAAKMLHHDAPEAHFRLILRDGSQLDFPDSAFDISLSVGVVNHVANPVETLNHLIRGARRALVTALWVTSEEEGFFALNHSGLTSYFFSNNDLRRIQAEHPEAIFLIAGFVPEERSSQRRSYIGITAEQEDALGSYHLLVVKGKDHPFDFSRLAL